MTNASNIRRRPIDVYEDAICGVLDLCFYGNDLSDEVSYEVSLATIAPEHSLSTERLDQLVRTWCAIGGVAVPS